MTATTLVDRSAGPEARPVHELVIAANRLPVRVDEQGSTVLSPGGLVSAMTAVMRGRDAAWIGWDGSTSPRSDQPPFHHGEVTCRPIALSDAERAGYYDGFSNATLWPLYHSGLLPTTFRRSWWSAYRHVNRRFADEAIAALAPGATLWIHDYHLQLVPAFVREARPDVRIGFFLHTPFPSSQLVMRLPWRTDIARGLLGADVIGFQTATGARNFLTLAHRLLGIDETVLDNDHATIEVDRRRVRVGTHPISIDIEAVDGLARTDSARAAADAFRQQIGNPKTVLLGVDRLDYTKGIDARLKAFRELLKDEQLDPADVCFVQVATPSRDTVPGYEKIRTDIEQLVGEINGDYAPLGRPVVQYLHKTLPFEDLVPLFLAADVMLVTPFEDGMNLVAKEYVISRVDETGVLVLSEFAGTAEELPDALLCNPFDIAGLKRIIRRAIDVPVDEQRHRMRRMRHDVGRNDVHHWASGFLGELE